MKVVARPEATRPDRDAYFMLMAAAAALRGTCGRLRVGCVVVDARGRVVSTGHNGAPPGFPHCVHEVGSKEPCLLAEHDAVNALVHGLPPADLPRVRGATLYTTDSPCERCARFIVAAGVERVVYAREYRDAKPLRWLAPRLRLPDGLVRWDPAPQWRDLFVRLLAAPEAGVP